MSAARLLLREQDSNQAECLSDTEIGSISVSEFVLVDYPTPIADFQKEIHLPCFLLDTQSKNEDFCGREDILERLAIDLLPSSSPTNTSTTILKQFALYGLGGIGKTELAREFARRYKASFDAVFWVVADEIAKLDQHYQQISLALELEDPSECKSQVVSREIVKGWLSNPRKQLSGSDEYAQPGQSSCEATWLLILDNADDPMILADYWPQGVGSIRVTSRDPLAKSMFTRRSSGLDLDPLTQRDSLSLFKHLTTVFDEPESELARKISDALGGVPLAISQMAGIIRRQDLTLSEFLELYTDLEERASLYATKFDTNLVTYRHTLSSVWAFEKLKPHARQLLELIAFLDPDVIGEDLLIAAMMATVSEESTFRKSNYLDARAELLQSSLIQRDKQKQQVSVHRIVQDAVVATMDSGRKLSMFDHAVDIIWADFPGAMPKPSRVPELPQPKSTGGRLHIGRWPICAALYPHVLKLHQLWPSIMGASEASKLQFAKLLNEAAWFVQTSQCKALIGSDLSRYQNERGRTKEFDGFFDTARSICESSSHPDRDSVLADIYFGLAAIAMDQCNFDLSRIYKELSFDLIFNICQEVGVSDDERLFLAYAERGISRTQDKRYEEAEADYREALRIRKALPNYVPSSLEANLGWALLAQGKLEECNKLLQDSLAGREKALGKDDRESARTGWIFYALGNLRAAENKWDDSFEYHQRALRHMQATVGMRDSNTAKVCHKVAEHLMRMNRIEEAIAMVNLALEIWFVDPNHRNGIARTTFLKGKLFEVAGKLQKASIAFRVASRLRREITKQDRDIKSLTTADFDGIVAFSAR